MPKKITDDIKFIAAGCDHTLAVKTDGSLWAWGANGNGQLGDGTEKESLTPKKIMEGAREAAAGGDLFLESSYTLAITEDGSLWAWGCNDYGQLGNGAWNGNPTPIELISAKQ